MHMQNNSPLYRSDVMNQITMHHSSNDLTLVCLQHLSTFIMDKTESITTVDDAIKKLKLLDSKDKIWTQEMLLQVTDKSIKLLDCETKVSVCVHICRN